MKRVFVLLTVLTLLLTACGSSQEPAQTDSTEPVLTVTDGTNEVTYSKSDLELLGDTQAEFKGVLYVGVPLADLLTNAGFDPTKLSKVKAVASDGFSSSYDPSFIMLDNTILAYARADGPLNRDDGNFRMVVPGQGGGMNARLVVRLVASE